MKRILALILVLLMVAPLLISCANEVIEEDTVTQGSDALASDPLPEANPDWVGKEYNVIYRYREEA